MKESYDEKILLKHLPHEMLDFYKHISSLSYYKKPDYKVGVIFSLLLNILLNYIKILRFFFHVYNSVISSYTKRTKSKRIKCNGKAKAKILAKNMFKYINKKNQNHSSLCALNILLGIISELYLSLQLCIRVHLQGCSSDESLAMCGSFDRLEI